MSETYLRLYENGFHPRHTKIKQLNLDGSLVKEFNSIKEASEYYGYNPDAISNNIRRYVFEMRSSLMVLIESILSLADNNYNNYGIKIFYNSS
jgi:hypothetical protein